MANKEKEVKVKKGKRRNVNLEHTQKNIYIKREGGTDETAAVCLLFVLMIL